MWTHWEVFWFNLNVCLVSWGTVWQVPRVTPFWATNKMEFMELKGWECHPEAGPIHKVTLLTSVPGGLSFSGDGFILTSYPYSLSAPNIHRPPATTPILDCRSLSSNARKCTPSASLPAKTISESLSDLPSPRALGPGEVINLLWKGWIKYYTVQLFELIEGKVLSKCMLLLLLLAVDTRASETPYFLSVFFRFF